MTFVDIPTLNGGVVHVTAESVFRVTRGAGAEATFTTVEFGVDMQPTRLPKSEVVSLLRNAGAKLVAFDAPDGTPVFLSVPAITLIKDADPHSDAPGARAVITVADHRQMVQQTRQQVKDLLAAKSKTNVTYLGRYSRVLVSSEL